MTRCVASAARLVPHERRRRDQQLFGGGHAKRRFVDLRPPTRQRRTHVCEVRWDSIGTGRCVSSHSLPPFVGTR
jgi:hypothetical protein